MMYDDIEVTALGRRAADAFDAHMDTFTAGAVIHDMYMEIIGTDPAGISALSLSLALLSAHQERTRAAWIKAQDEWLFASAMVYDSDLYDDEEDHHQ
ncbi:hypothetical protein E0F15_11280 [Frankia sp. B2]|uniref:hypothetical protein n=1 Tax=unclassified Frankia TaxID=2632575 RepID=UPI000461A874|nr:MULTISPECIES: hypothetical protein [unclassified Frankia]KDA40758.1 hypothetical protein BMG523Draft_04422 [Frankia sp. BMG5.23]TFE30430.1 hypothetical protein E0F15_11280 [Frankia sp. B2]